MFSGLWAGTEAGLAFWKCLRMGWRATNSFSCVVRSVWVTVSPHSDGCRGWQHWTLLPIWTEGSVLGTELRVPVLGILGSRSSLEDLTSCPCSLGVLNSPLLAGLHSGIVSHLLWPKKAKSQQQWWFYVDMNEPVSWVEYCLTSEWQQGWVFPVFGVCEGKMNPVIVI